MADSISYIFEVAIKPGQLENFKALMREMIESTWANEPRTLSYEWFISPDGATCHTCERYADSAAIVQHMKAVGEQFSQRYFMAVEPKRLVVYGDPGEEVREIFAKLNPVYLKNAAGFAR